jgi:hypothetical protein
MYPVNSETLQPADTNQQLNHTLTPCAHVTDRAWAPNCSTLPVMMKWWEKGVGFRLNWGEMRFKLVHKILKICMPLDHSWLCCWKNKTALSDTDPKRHLSILHVSHQASHAIRSLVVEFNFLGHSSSFWSFRIPIWLMGVVFSSNWSGLIGLRVWLIPNLHPLKIISIPNDRCS